MSVSDVRSPGNFINWSISQCDRNLFQAVESGSGYQFPLLTDSAGANQTTLCITFQTWKLLGIQRVHVCTLTRGWRTKQFFSFFSEMTTNNKANKKELRAFRSNTISAQAKNPMLSSRNIFKRFYAITRIKKIRTFNFINGLFATDEGVIPESSLFDIRTAAFSKTSFIVTAIQQQFIYF